MRVLLDENVPHDLKTALVGHDVVTVQGLGWSGTLNGELLKRASGTIEAFVTLDRRLEHQHEISALPFGVVILRVRSSKMQDLAPLVQGILDALASLRPGQRTDSGRLLAIVFTTRGTRVRVISARPMSRAERRAYGQIEAKSQTDS